MTVQADKQGKAAESPMEYVTLAASCRACGSTKLRSVLNVPNLPAFCNVLLDNAEAARSVRRGDLKLVYCEDCSFLFNSDFDAAVLAYSPDYANSLSCSPSFGSFLQEMSVRLVEKHDLNDKTVLELGCGDGDFLTRLCTIGENRGFGFDPSYFGPNLVDAGKGVKFEARYYGSDDDVAPDLVCSRHVLEHVEEPLEFVKLLAGAMKVSSGKLYIEVPNATYMLEKPAIWDLIYEHPGYFTDRALVAVAEKAGLNVTDAQPAFLDQFLYIDADSMNGSTGSFLDQTTDLETLDRLVSGFSDEFERIVTRWNERLTSLATHGKQVVTWGAGSKGVTFLNLVRAGNIEHIVDINPAKHGRFVPGTGQSVIGPESLVDHRPDIVLLMNGAYENEVKQQLVDLGVDAEVVVVD